MMAYDVLNGALLRVCAPMPSLPAVLLPAFLAFLALIPVAAADESEGIWINPASGVSSPEEAAERLHQPFYQWLGRLLPDMEKIRGPALYKDLETLTPETGFLILRDRFRHSASGRIYNCAALLDYFDHMGKYSVALGDKAGSDITWYLGDNVLDYCIAYRNLARLQPVQREDTTTPDFLANKLTLQRISPAAFSGGKGSATTCRAIRYETGNRPLAPFYKLRVYPYFGRHTPVVAGEPWRESLPATWAVWPAGDLQSLQGVRFFSKIHFEDSRYYFTLAVWGAGRWPPQAGVSLIVLVSGGPSHNRYGHRVHEAQHQGRTTVLSHDRRLDIFRFRNVTEYRPYAFDQFGSAARCFP